MVPVLTSLNIPNPAQVQSIYLQPEGDLRRASNSTKTGQFIWANFGLGPNIYEHSYNSHSEPAKPTRLPPLLSNKQPQLNSSRPNLLPLNLPQQPLLKKQISIQIHVPLLRPLPRRKKKRSPIHLPIAQNPQKTLARVLHSRKLNAHLARLLERLLGQNVRFHVPRRHDVHAAAVVECRSAQSVHHASHAPFCSAVLRCSRDVEEGGARADEHEAGVLLGGGGNGAVLLDEVVECEFGCVHDGFEVDVEDVQAGLLGLFVVACWQRG